MTGRVGAQRIGVLNVVTDGAFGRPRTNFAVARVTHDVGTNNYVGVMMTDRRTSGGWNTTGGVDWSFWANARLVFNGFVSATATSGDGGEGSAFRGELDYTGDFFGFNIAHLSISPDARADMGFITRTDIRKSTAFFRVTPRPKALGLRSLTIRWGGTHVMRTDGTLQDWSIGPALMPTWNSGENFTTEFQYGFTRLDQAGAISGVPVPAGDYDTWFVSFMGQTSANRPVVLSGNARYQSIYDGDISSVGGSLTLTPNANVSAVLGYAHNRIDLPSGALNADIGSLRIAIAMTTQFTADALIQYNERDDALSANIRFNFIHTPGSDLFLVINEQRGMSDSIWDLNTRSTVAKITYLARL